MIVINVLIPNPHGDILPMEVDPNQSVGAFLQTIQEMTSMENCQLVKETTVLEDQNRTLQAYGIVDNDLVRVVPKPPPVDRYTALAERIRQHLAPAAAAAPPPIDPDSADGQRMILEAINRERLNRNLEEAMTTMPESFVQVTMLYIDISLNGIPVQAFVDSGAQTSIISRELAEQCNIAHLIDERYQGVAKGVGEAKIIGRIHKTQMQAAGAEFDVSLTVLEGTGQPLLFGLDLLYRHQCVIDLKQRALIIAGIVELPFLDASQIRAG